MYRVRRSAMAAPILLVAVPALAQPSAYVERWASGTLTTGEVFESWRIRVVVPEGDDWLGSSIEAVLVGEGQWYYDAIPGWTPQPDLFASEPDAEFDTFWTTAGSYPNSDQWLDDIVYTADLVQEPTYLRLSYWGDQAASPAGDYVVWQGTVLNPPPGAYGTIEFSYVMQSWTQEQLTFVIPEPASAVLLLALAAAGSRLRRG